jgi:hypothetical protein
MNSNSSISSKLLSVEVQSFDIGMGDSSYRLNFDQGKKNEIQYHS